MVGSLFGIQKLTPTPVPAAPIDDSAAVKARTDAEAAAIAERRGAGRAGTVVAGATIAMEDQRDKGLLSQKKRSQMVQDLGL